MSLYRALLRPLLFRIDAETAHGLAIGAGELAGSSSSPCSALERRHAVDHARLALEVGALRFRNPLDLAAGLDKSARAVPLLATLGFGHDVSQAVGVDA